jgi:hypothetical protein
MFDENEVKKLIEKYDDETINSNAKLKYINNKINKHGYIYINISELNYLYYLNNVNIKYDITKLKDIFKTNNIGYTSIIKNIGIPKATLSKIFNNDRNIKLIKLNNFFEKANEVYSLKLSKNIIKEGE